MLEPSAVELTGDLIIEIRKSTSATLSEIDAGPPYEATAIRASWGDATLNAAVRVDHASGACFLVIGRGRTCPFRVMPALTSRMTRR